MQDNTAPFEQNYFVQNNGNSQQGSSVCSNSTLSDTGSWDTDFEDDINSESSGLYGDVELSVTEKPSSDAEGKQSTRGSVQGRVAALAKTVAASLAASGSPCGAKSAKSYHQSSDVLQKNVNTGENSRIIASSSRVLQRSQERQPSTPQCKPPVPSRPSATSLNACMTSAEQTSPTSYRSNSGGPHPFIHAFSTSTLPKPPGPASEQVQQVIGALGQLCPSDSISLSSQTQSDDDYEPVQSEPSPQLTGLSSRAPSYVHHESPNRTLPPETHSSQGQGQQPFAFLHSPAAAAALATAAASAVANRLSQSSKRSSGSEYYTSTSSSLSEKSLQSVLPGQQDGVYEPIEEKEKFNVSALKSYLHSSEKLDVKRTTVTSQTLTKTFQQDQRPPVPNRPLPPTPKPTEKISGDSVRGGSRIANLENHLWFHNVDRKQAEQVIKNGSDGYFLIRPSSQSQNPLTLTLLYNQRVYNISVRQRKDGRIALGFEKPDEQSFESIEEMVTNYQSENLLLFSRNERTGRTVLTKSPPKQRST